MSIATRTGAVTKRAVGYGGLGVAAVGAVDKFGPQAMDLVNKAQGVLKFPIGADTPMTSETLIKVGVGAILTAIIVPLLRGGKGEAKPKAAAPAKAEVAHAPAAHAAEPAHDAHAPAAHASNGHDAHADAGHHG